MCESLTLSLVESKAVSRDMLRGGPARKVGRPAVNGNGRFTSYPADGRSFVLGCRTMTQFASLLASLLASLPRAHELRSMPK